MDLIELWIFQYITHKCVTEYYNHGCNSARLRQDVALGVLTEYLNGNKKKLSQREYVCILFLHLLCIEERAFFTQRRQTVCDYIGTEDFIHSMPQQIAFAARNSERDSTKSLARTCLIQTHAVVFKHCLKSNTDWMRALQVFKDFVELMPIDENKDMYTICASMKTVDPNDNYVYEYLELIRHLVLTLYSELEEPYLIKLAQRQDSVCGLDILDSGNLSQNGSLDVHLETEDGSQQEDVDSIYETAPQDDTRTSPGPDRVESLSPIISDKGLDPKTVDEVLLKKRRNVSPTPDASPTDASRRKKGKSTTIREMDSDMTLTFKSLVTRVADEEFPKKRSGSATSNTSCTDVSRRIKVTSSRMSETDSDTPLSDPKTVGIGTSKKQRNDSTTSDNLSAEVPGRKRVTSSRMSETDSDTPLSDLKTVGVGTSKTQRNGSTTSDNLSAEVPGRKRVTSSRMSETDSDTPLSDLKTVGVGTSKTQRNGSTTSDNLSAEVPGRKRVTSSRMSETDSDTPLSDLKTVGVGTSKTQRNGSTTSDNLSAEVPGRKRVTSSRILQTDSDAPLSDPKTVGAGFSKKGRNNSAISNTSSKEVPKRKRVTSSRILETDSDAPLPDSKTAGAGFTKKGRSDSATSDTSSSDASRGKTVTSTTIYEFDSEDEATETIVDQRGNSLVFSDVDSDGDVGVLKGLSKTVNCKRGAGADEDEAVAVASKSRRDSSSSENVSERLVANGYGNSSPPESISYEADESGNRTSSELAVLLRDIRPSRLSDLEEIELEESDMVSQIRKKADKFNIQKHADNWTRLKKQINRKPPAHRNLCVGPWMVEEEEAFIRSTLILGIGKWRRIKEELQTVRSSQQLKDKWRNLKPWQIDEVIKQMRQKP